MRKIVAIALLSVCLTGLLLFAAPSDAAQRVCAVCRWVPATSQMVCDFSVGLGGFDCVVSGYFCYTVGECSTGLTVTR